ncbi:MAG: phospholipase C, phosphocholine-specific [Acidobacteria bacterium]|nr:phospholipase C, phosphocholine-specific [Acidobacteriota bacterium]
MSSRKSRRDFFRMSAALAGATMFPASIRQALAIPADRRTGTIDDVEHVVILMQENRSFDHYFGTLRGVRGFSDPRPAPLPGGKSIWHQPIATTKTKKYHDRGLSPNAKHVLPFYINPQQTTEFQAGTDHGWSTGHLAWNNGHWNQWVNQKQDVLTMGHLKRQDVSFHYALADAFTLCDAYHCSVHSATAPNRIYMWSGTIDAQNAYGTRPNGPGFDERHKVNGYTWTTYPERLEKAGISWKLYQGGSGEPGTPTDNYTDNSLEFFAQYHVQEGASPTGPLVQKGVTDRTLAGFKQDVQNGKLAQVNWIVAPYKYSEHPEASPTDGAYYISLVLDALTANPDVWSKTVMLINYDENDGLFDHIVPPMPPKSQERDKHGLVSGDLVASLADEFIDMSKYPSERRPIIPKADPGGIQPIGLGPRVPMLVVSPWSTGGWVCSQVFDHTSVIRFLEKRFNIEEPNISRWRRSLCGDLTSAFDFSQKPAGRATSFPPPKPIQSLHQPYSVPEPQTMPVQEQGTRPARALPYALQTACRVEADRVTLDLINKGAAGAAFYIYNGVAPNDEPRRYTVSSGDTLTDHWSADAGKPFDLAAYGPNGYLVHFKGVAASEEPAVTVQPESSGTALSLTLTNRSSSATRLSIAESYTNFADQKDLAPNEDVTLSIPLHADHRWYDIAVTVADNKAYLRRFAGHAENGQPGSSDPKRYDGG